MVNLERDRERIELLSGDLVEEWILKVNLARHTWRHLSKNPYFASVGGYALALLYETTVICTLARLETSLM